MLVAVILPLLPMVPGTALRGSQSSEALASNRESVPLMPVRAVNIPAFHTDSFCTSCISRWCTITDGRWFETLVSDSRPGWPISGNDRGSMVIASLSLLVRLASGYHSLRRSKHRTISGQ